VNRARSSGQKPSSLRLSSHHFDGTSHLHCFFVQPFLSSSDRISALRSSDSRPHAVKASVPKLLGLSRFRCFHPLTSRLGALRSSSPLSDSDNLQHGRLSPPSSQAALPPSPRYRSSRPLGLLSRSPRVWLSRSPINYHTYCGELWGRPGDAPKLLHTSMQT
jgi:hypothetical protein